MKQFIKSQPHWAVAIMAIVVVGLYWFLWAEERYVSRATVVLESPQIAQPEMDFSSILTGTSGSSDLLLLREHLLSVDMLKRIQEELDFRDHYSEHGDLFARLLDAEAPIEELHKYYLRRVEVEMDEYAGVLNIRVEGYTPDFAHAMASLLLEAGEAHMNEMGRRLAEEQVRFLEGQLERLDDRLDEARAELLAYQNKHGLVSPTSTVESINQVVATLEGELARLQAQRNALASFQSEQSSEMRRVQSEITAMREQIDLQRDRLAQATGNSLNRISAEYQTLELRAMFAQETYSSALGALESTRLEAARKLKQVSVLQSPLYPEYATSPDRLYNASVFAIVTIFLAFIASMLVLIIRDHRD
ncbi:chain-length determining protein [Halomonas urumqiensis]|uniref:Chain-length determining protein n=1 Tax=Halomonas urumqiensis TaxID=1684789 RepID=A0A2N7UCE9_9GAMM|nr:chain-length determining protein [Halomonas urumqiensis]PMR78119.1 chain-length determining protein [Halomonas urumqiensis]PTB03270.1 chain-length determining protein [Halomonas urumqiensis]GHE20571.1 capsule polysaccharide export inner-membrane protein KpsE [Halomonas urumqiensis]